MANFQTIQQQTNAASDARLHSEIDAAVNFGKFNSNIRVSLVKFKDTTAQLDDLRDAIRKAIFDDQRDAWRTKYGETVVNSAMGQAQ